jgi:hypothetical protein
MQEDWLDDYAYGMGHEIYRTRLSYKMEDKYFKDISKIVYKKSTAIVFALELKCNGKTIIRLNPSDFKVNNIKENNVHVYSICPDKRDAETIETLFMSNDEKNRYLIQKNTGGYDEEEGNNTNQFYQVVEDNEAEDLNKSWEGSNNKQDDNPR